MHIPQNIKYNTRDTGKTNIQSDYSKYLCYNSIKGPRMKYIFSSMLTLFLFISCTESETIIDYPSAEYQHFSENKKLWKSKNIKDYSFVIQKSCFCPQEEKRQITVSDGIISEAKYIPSNTVLDPNQEKINGYFNIIQDALDKNAYKVTVTYDGTYGFPSNIAIDYNEQMADEEINYTLTHFIPNNNRNCDTQYKPVCAKVDILCVTTPCESIEQTFSNTCVMNLNPNTTYLRDGEC